eukprot:CAMPEP_0113957028 /NCGR_PEP_ID=MMETSP0011_2-20120614/2466_1 /TAXON_ID=101924 /ORGANISM="Rhodosorus marinus" /LENGTH=1005 /DNA_ID=CAMNT_0000967393 /DNA_START=87 /DNA_END=3104 /DNA_ORIENTATION=+ /assembly_acc=CAM_ASM_000156
MSFLNSSSTAWDLRGGRQRPLIVRYSSMKGDPSPGNSLPKRRGDYSKPWRDRKLPELWAIARETPNEGKLWVEIAKREISTASKREALQSGLEYNERNAYLWHMLGMVYWREGSPGKADAVFAEAICKCEPGSRAAIFQAKALLLKETSRSNSEKVISLLEEGLTDDDRHGPLYVALANHYEEIGKNDLAHKTFEKGARKASKHAAVWRAWGNFEQKRGHLHEARSKWERATQISPHEPRSWLNYAELERQIGSDTNACSILREALKRNPSSSEIRVMLAKVVENLEGPAEARLILQAEIQSSDRADNTSGLVLRALGSLEAREGNVGKAREYYSILADRPARFGDAEIIKALHAWALLEVKQGNSKEAGLILGRATSISPRDAGIWRAIAELETRQRNFNQARDAFQRAVSAQPSDPRLWLAWGRMEMSAQADSRACELLEKASQSSVREHTLPMRQYREVKRVQCDALREMAALAMRAGDFKLCQERCISATKKDPSNAHAWRDLADVSMKDAGLGAMRAVYDKALRSVPQSTQPKLYHWLGLEERRCGDPNRAREAFEKAIAADESYISTWTSWALLEKETGNLEESCTIFERAADVASRRNLRVPFLFMTWGRVLDREVGDIDRARGVYREGLDQNQGFSPLYQAWGQLEERQGDISSARELYCKAYEADPHNGSLWQSAALLEVQQRNLQTARDLFEKGISMDPKNAALYVSYAVVEARQGGIVGVARDLFKKATSVDPKFALAWHAWGAAEFREGNLDAAERLYEQAGKLDEGDPVCWHALGMLHRSRGDLDLARDYFRKALVVDGKHALSYQSLALLEAKEPQGLGFQTARRILREATTIVNVRDGWPVWQTWAVLEADAGNMDEAQHILQAAIEEVPNCAQLYQTYAVLKRDESDYEEARRLFDAGARASPKDSAPVYSAWGKMEEDCGYVERARELYQKGIEVNPSNSVCWNLYAALEASEGNSDEADRLKFVASGFSDDSDGSGTSPSLLETDGY